MIPTREAIEKISPKHVDEEEDNVSDSDSSRTLSADETKKCEEELRLRESRMNFDDLKQSKTREEFEASEALISLAESWFEQTSGEDLIQQSSTDLKLLKPLTLNDLIQIEHNYCIQIPQEPSPIPSPVAKRKRQSKKVLSETKRKKKKGELITDENVTPNVLAVASEWRKAKRKSVRQPELVSSENIMINDENQLLGNEIKSLPPPPSITFEKRDAKMEESILFEFLDVGLESEDIGYLKRRYHQLLEEDNSNLTWLNDIHWVDHPATYWQPPKKKRKDDSLARIHETGCARSEGYYKLDRMEKMHHIANIPIASNEMEDPNRPKQIVTTQQLTREARNQRRLYNLVEQQVSSYHTDLLKLNQLKFRKKQVKFARSKIHVWGLFAMQPIPPDEMVIEYIGQRIRPMVAEIREKKYLNAGSSYLFKIDSDTIIDATHCGNVARFINHSCNVSIIHI
uniref:[histone H3]-lysine(4) N-trimethyltransferase n=1 Tax=Psoroptes ovis TaxID=83912 RepID=A0A3B0QP73_PSOOV|nr:histone-lysineN-methyltransferase SETD1 [Psoroptes ovis]